ncbi:MAG: SCP2 sterol-binding domain-containing protein [Acidimicrobiales bacterium]
MTAAFLSEDWLELQRQAAADLPPQPSVSATVEHVVTGAPGGSVVYTTTYEEGRVAAAALGRGVAPDLTFTLTYYGAQRLARGELETGAAFMQGALKVEGDMAKLFWLLELSHHPEHRAMVGRVAAQTEF